MSTESANFSRRIVRHYDGEWPPRSGDDNAPDAADFSGLSPLPLAISDVVQEAVLKVAEEGVEAAAVTVVAMRAGSAAPPPQRLLHLAFDRPFGIVVLPAESDVPLFTAWQADAPTDPA